MALRLKKGDVVQVIAGEHKGSKGKIRIVDYKTNRVVIENVNMVKRHTKPNQTGNQGGIIEKEAPIHISNVLYVCDKTGKPTRLGTKVLEDGSKVRYSKKSKEQVD